MGTDGTGVDERDGAVAPASGAWQRLRARPGLLLGLGSLVIGGLVVVLVWFQPQTLLFDDVVDEEFPGPPPVEDPDAAAAAAPEDAAPAEADDPAETADPAEAEDPAEVDDPTEVAGPVALASGRFTSRSRYSVEGEATTYRLEDGSRVLRLEEFASTNGPDLFVYLTVADADASDDELGADVVDLGILTGNIGAQNYQIPAEVDLERYDTVVVWCRRFTVAFGAADLVAAG